MNQKTAFDAKILIISNQETKTGFLVSYSLEQENYNVIPERVPANALKRWEEVIPDLIILDMNYPTNLILQLITSLREVTIAPMILITRGLPEDDLNKVYAAGIDDCIAKPLGPTVFLAKVRAWLRVSQASATRTLLHLKVGDVLLIPERKLLVMAGGTAIDLTNLEMHLLYSLMSRPRHIVSREQLVRDVWGEQFAGDAVMVKNLVYRLRTKLKDRTPQEIIHTVPHGGYMFMPES